MRVNNRGVRHCIDFLDCFYTARREASCSFSSCIAIISSAICRIRRAASSRDQFQTTSSARNDSPLFFDRFHPGRLPPPLPNVRERDTEKSSCGKMVGDQMTDENDAVPRLAERVLGSAPQCSYTPRRAPAATAAASLTAKLSS